MRVSRALVPLLVPALLSCNSLESPDGPKIALYLEMSTTSIPLGGQVDVTVIARNVGLDPLVLSGPSDCLLYVEAFNTEGQRVYTSAASCGGAVVDVEVAAGDQREVSLQWGGTSTAGARLASGIYHLRPAALLQGRVWVQPGANVEVE